MDGVEPPAFRLGVALGERCGDTYLEDSARRTTSAHPDRTSASCGAEQALQEIRASSSGPTRRCLRVQLAGADSTYSLKDGCFDIFPADAEPITADREFSMTFDTSVG